MEVLIKEILNELNVGAQQANIFFDVTPTHVQKWLNGRIPVRRHRKKIIEVYEKLKKTEDKRYILKDALKSAFINNKYGLIIRSIRRRLNLSQSELGELCQINPDLIYQYERGNLRLSKSVFEKFYGIIIQMYGNLTQDLHDSVIAEIKQLETSVRYPEIINFREQKSEGTAFELEVYRRLKESGVFSELFLWPVLADRKLIFKQPVDIYGITNDGKKILIEVKDLSYSNPLANRIKNSMLFLGRIQEIDKLIFVFSKEFPSVKKHFETNRLLIINKDDISKISEYLSPTKESYQKINKLKQFRTKYKFSREQLAELTGVSNDYIRRIETGKFRMTNTIRQKLIEIEKMVKISGLVKSHFIANKLLLERSPGPILKIIRLQCGINQRDLAKEIGVNRTRLQNIEACKCLNNKLELMVSSHLREKADNKGLNYNELTNRAKILLSEHFKKVGEVSNYFNCVLKLDIPPNRLGQELENYSIKCFKDKGYAAFQNVIVSDPKMSLVTEVDGLVYNPSTQEKAVISCLESAGKICQKLNEVILIKDMIGLDKAYIFCGDKVSDYTKRKANKCAVEIIEAVNYN